jgi:hypothetical protein
MNREVDDCFEKHTIGDLNFLSEAPSTVGDVQA